MSDKIERRQNGRRNGDRRKVKGVRPMHLPDRRNRGERRRLRDRRA